MSLWHKRAGVSNINQDPSSESLTSSVPLWSGPDLSEDISNWSGVEEHGVGFCVDLTAAGNSPANIEYSFKDHSIHAL